MAWFILGDTNMSIAGVSGVMAAGYAEQGLIFNTTLVVAETVAAAQTRQGGAEGGDRFTQKTEQAHHRRHHHQGDGSYYESDATPAVEEPSVLDALA
jgi:hypothetical protein